MTLNLSKTLLTFSASILLVAASATSSDARPQAKRLSRPSHLNRVFKARFLYESKKEQRQLLPCAVARFPRLLGAPVHLPHRKLERC